MAAASRKAVVFAILGNGVLTVLKFGAALIGHSASMMNEAVHSLMDTLNQVFLFFGLVQGQRPADETYAFGHGQKKYLWNLWSAIGLFSIGCGLGLAHAWHVWHKGAPGPPPETSIAGFSFPTLWISVIVLIIALVVEGLVLAVAVRELRRQAAARIEQNAIRYLFRADDPTLVAVVLEDTVAVTGVCLAAAGIGLSAVTGNPHWDIVFSVAIAVMLGLVAFFLGWVNMGFLVAKRDPEAELEFERIARDHPEVERFHDVRSLVVDEQHIVVVAEIELREEAVVPGLRRRLRTIESELAGNVSLEHRDNPGVNDYIRARAAVIGTLERTEQIIDELERELKRRCPRVSHVTFEVEGIAADPDNSAMKLAAAEQPNTE